MEILIPIKFLYLNDSDAGLYEAGDYFIMKPGYVGAWRKLETVRKMWFTA